MKLISDNIQKIAFWACSLLLAVFASMVPAGSSSEPLFSANDYSSCVISSINVSIASEEVNDIRQACRTNFPASSSLQALVWSDVAYCYDEYEPRAGNRTAALAIFNACSEYFL